MKTNENIFFDTQNASFFPRNTKVYENANANKLKKGEIDLMCLQWQQMDEDACEKTILGDYILSLYKTKIQRYVLYLLKNHGGNAISYFDDAYQEGLMVFYDMLKTYDPKKNDNPFLYAKKQIQRKVYQYVNCYVYECKPWVAKNSAKVTKILQESPYADAREIASKLEISEKRAAEYLNSVQTTLSYDKNDMYLSSLQDPSTHVHEDVLYEITHESLLQELSYVLEPKEMDFLFCYYGIFGDKKSANDISKEQNCTPSEVRSIVQKAIEKIQKSKSIMDLLSID